MTGGSLLPRCTRFARRVPVSGTHQSTLRRLPSAFKCLWKVLERPNVFIKVPATLEGLEAIKQFISQGINVNVTLLCGLPRYRRVAKAYIAGLEERATKGQPLERVASVASFFLSRIDLLVDPLLEKKMEEGGPLAETARGICGEVAIASAKMAYQIYRKIFQTERFRKL